MQRRCIPSNKELRLVALPRVPIRDEEAGGSNPLTPTICNPSPNPGLRDTRLYGRVVPRTLDAGAVRETGKRAPEGGAEDVRDL